MERADLEKLYELYGYAVHRRCCRLLGSEAEADDALQEVFMRVMRYGETFQGQSPLPWLYRIADRHCFDRLHAKKRWVDAPDDSPESDDQIARPAPDRLRAVAQVLAACQPRVREIAVLYYVDEMTQEEVAEAVGYSRKTVRQKLAKFLEIGRRMLALPGEGRAR